MLLLLSLINEDIKMTRVDLTPLYRSSIGFDHFGSLLDAAFQAEKNTSGYPPYNIEVLEENSYAITLAVAGFKEADLTLETENGVLTIRGSQSQDEKRTYLHQGIARRSFERKFNLADHVKVTNASLADGLLSIELVREIPEAMKPKSISINGKNAKIIEQKDQVA
jgi:molecular chaperone IbpA